MSDYVFPAVGKLGKLPHITVAETDLIQKYLDWFDSHKELPRTVPPLWKDFVLEFSRRFPAEKGKSAATHYYTEVVHYHDDLCGFDAMHIIDGKKVLVVESRYSDYRADGMMYATGRAPETTKYTEQWLRNEGISVTATIIAVQLYILCHKPEVVPVVLPEPPKRHKAANPPKKPVPRPKVIKDTVTKYIRLTSSDPEPKQIKYRAVSWMVRGHYRNQYYKTGNKLIYIAPHRAARGEKKLKPQQYELR